MDVHFIAMARKNRETFQEAAAQSSPQEPAGHLSTREHKVIHPQTENQRRYFSSMYHNVITIAAGEAGCGKTLLALYQAVRMLAAGKIERVVYIKPDIGMYGQRGRGFLPGTAFEKAQPLIGPVLDNLSVFMPVHQAKYHLEKETIEVKLLEDIRGLSFHGCMAILDEAQNVYPWDIKTFLSRVGEGSRMVVCGDTAQVDRSPTDMHSNGLADAIRRLDNLRDVGIVRFGRADIVRHPIIPEVLARYDVSMGDSYNGRI